MLVWYPNGGWVKPYANLYPPARKPRTDGARLGWNGMNGEGIGKRVDSN